MAEGGKSKSDKKESALEHGDRAHTRLHPRRWRADPNFHDIDVAIGGDGDAGRRPGAGPLAGRLRPCRRERCAGRAGSESRGRTPRGVGGIHREAPAGSDLRAWVGLFATLARDKSLAGKHLLPACQTPSGDAHRGQRCYFAVGEIAHTKLHPSDGGRKPASITRDTA
jgi:hypothetical protein